MISIILLNEALSIFCAQGLRKAVLIGSFGTCLGTWIKVFSASPNLFAVAFVGQTVVAVSQIFVLGIPPLLAAIWFGPDQVSTATSIGVFGNQVSQSLSMKAFQPYTHTHSHTCVFNWRMLISKFHYMNIIRRMSKQSRHATFLYQINVNSWLVRN